MKIMKAVKIADNIYWVGAIDWDLRNFHDYLTQRGSTYNAYLIVDEKITLIDTVKHYLFSEMLERVASVIDPSKIDYIVSNHVEMDHSGSIPVMAGIAKNAKIITSTAGEKGLKLHYGDGLNLQAVKTGDSMSIGKRTLNFVLTPMVHWPDNMVCYVPEDKILFSNDAFGQHLATSERFDDQYPPDRIMEEAKKYYANIVLPFSAQVKKALEAASRLDISVIAPSHGIIWRENIGEIIEQYTAWADNQTENRALVIYDTMWNSTKLIAGAVQRAFEHKDIPCAMLDLKHNHISDVMTEVLTARYICVGSPTLNNNMLPTVAAFLTYFRGLAPKKRTALAFGSFGWGGQSVDQVDAVLKDCGLETMEKIKVQYVPSADTLSEISAKVAASL
ncbi:MAG TPA: FprA family A-type flavoprotein [Spirochaetes bacterium]|nr:FprA family A-type flavoprotein [Spirochaetota bacterium]